jgi:hypothetical protein
MGSSASKPGLSQSYVAWFANVAMPATTVMGGAPPATLAWGAGPVAGGALEWAGGYSGSAEHASKDEVLRRFARAVAAAEPRMRADAPPDELVRQMLDLIPDPAGNGRELKAKAATAKVCEALAKAMREQFGSEMFDENLSPAALCRQLRRALTAYASGLRVELATVLKNMQEALQQMREAREALAAVLARIPEAKKAELPGLMKAAAKMLEVIAEDARELEDWTKTATAPASRALEETLSRADGDIREVIDDRLRRLGLDAAPEDIGRTIYGIATASSATLELQRALEKLGTTAAKFRALGAKARAEFLKEMRDDPQVALDPEKMAALDRAMENLGWADRLQGGAGGAAGGAAGAAAAGGDPAGGAAGGVSRKDVSEKIKKMNEARKTALTYYARRMNALYVELAGAVDGVRQAVTRDNAPAAREIPAALVKAAAANATRQDLAILGLADDAAAREAKRAILAAFQTVADAAEAARPGFKGGEAALAALADVCRRTAKFIDEIGAAVAPRLKVGGADDAIEEFKPASVEMLQSIPRPPVSLTQKIAELRYRLFSAEIEANIAAAGPVIAEAAKGSEELCAKAVRARLDVLQHWYAEDVLKVFDKPSTWTDTIAGHDTAEHEVADKRRPKILAVVRQQLAAVEDMYGVLQELEVHLQKLQADIARDPGLLASIRGAVNMFALPVPLFSDVFGNSLARGFDNFFTAAADGSKVTATLAQNFKDPAKHYYENAFGIDAGAAGPSAVVPEFGDPSFVMTLLAAPGQPVLKTPGDKAVGLKDEFATDEHLDEIAKRFTEAWKNFTFLRVLFSVFAQAFKIPSTYRSVPQMYDATVRALAMLSLEFSVTGGKLVCKGADKTALAADVGFHASDETSPGMAFERHYLRLALEAVAAKVMTLVGGHALLAAPIEADPELFPVWRGVIGGAPPDARPELAALYAVVPAYLKFYKTIMAQTVAGSEWISIDPLAAGHFSALLMYVQQHMSQSLSTDDARYVISEINKLADEHYAKRPTLQEFVRDLAAAASRALSQLSADVEKALKELRRTRRRNAPGDWDRTGVPQMFDDELADAPTRPLPSDLLRSGVAGSTQSSDTWTAPEKTFHVDLATSMTTILDMMEKALGDGRLSKLMTVSADDYAKRLAAAKDPTARLDLAVDMARGATGGDVGSPGDVLAREVLGTTLRMLDVLAGTVTGVLVPTAEALDVEAEAAEIVGDETVFGTDVDAPSTMERQNRALAYIKKCGWLNAGQTIPANYTTSPVTKGAAQTAGPLALRLATAVGLGCGAHGGSMTLDYADLKLDGATAAKYPQAAVNLVATKPLADKLTAVLLRGIFDQARYLATGIDLLTLLETIAPRSVRFDDLHVDVGALEGAVRGLYDAARAQFGALSPVMSKPVREAFEKKMADVDVTVYEKLIDLGDDTTKSPFTLLRDHLEGFLRTNFGSKPLGDIAAVSSAETLVVAAPPKEAFADALRMLTFYTPVNWSTQAVTHWFPRTSGAAKRFILPSAFGPLVELAAPAVSLGVSDRKGMVFADLAQVVGTGAGPLMVTMNGIIRYLLANGTDASLRFYSPLIKAVTASVVGPCVASPDSIAFPAVISGTDTVLVPVLATSGLLEATLPVYGAASTARVTPVDAWTTVRAKDPAPDQMLISPLAIVLNRLDTTQAERGQTGPKYLLQTISDVPQHLLANYRAVLPVVVKMCDQASLRARVLVEAVPRFARQGAEPAAVTAVRGAIGTIRSVIQSIAQHCRDTLREMGDRPQFLATRDRFIEEYQQQFGAYPPSAVSFVTDGVLNYIGDVYHMEDTGRVSQLIPYATALRTVFTDPKVVQAGFATWLAQVAEAAGRARPAPDVLRQQAELLTGSAAMIDGMRLASRMLNGNLLAAGGKSRTLTWDAPAVVVPAGATAITPWACEVGPVDVISLVETSSARDIEVKLGSAVAGKEGVQEYLLANVPPIIPAAFASVVPFANVYLFARAALKASPEARPDAPATRMLVSQLYTKALLYSLKDDKRGLTAAPSTPDTPDTVNIPGSLDKAGMGVVRVIKPKAGVFATTSTVAGHRADRFITDEFIDIARMVVALQGMIDAASLGPGERPLQRGLAALRPGRTMLGVWPASGTEQDLAGSAGLAPLA